MQPVLDGEDVVLVNRLAYDVGKPERFDIVAFERNNIAKKPFRYIILGNEKELDMESLGKIGPIKRLTTEEVFGY